MVIAMMKESTARGLRTKRWMTTVLSTFVPNVPSPGIKVKHSIRAVGSFWSAQWSVPGIDNILYAVSTDNWRTVDIMDNKLVVVASFGLLCV